MTDHDPRWWDAERAAREWADDAVACGDVDLDDEDRWDEYAFETADGCHDVIYTYAYRSIFCSSGFPDWAEDEAKEFDPESPDQWMQIAVLLAIKQAIVDRFQELRDERDTVESE